MACRATVPCVLSRFSIALEMELLEVLLRGSIMLFRNAVIVLTALDLLALSI